MPFSTLYQAISPVTFSVELCRQLIFMVMSCRKYNLPPACGLPPGIDDCCVHFLCLYVSSLYTAHDARHVLLPHFDVTKHPACPVLPLCSAPYIPKTDFMSLCCVIYGHTLLSLQRYAQAWEQMAGTAPCTRR